jgi:GxxExxY protein
VNHEPHERLVHADEVFRIQGAVFEVNRVLGAGFLEAVYQEALGLEFGMRDIPFVAKPQLAIAYKGARLRQTYAPDFICFDRVIVELKAVREIVSEHRAQTINYLKVTGLRVALLVNFGGLGRAPVERIVV